MIQDTQQLLIQWTKLSKIKSEFTELEMVPLFSLSINLRLLFIALLVRRTLNNSKTWWGLLFIVLLVRTLSNSKTWWRLLFIALLVRALENSKIW